MRSARLGMAVGWRGCGGHVGMSLVVVRLGEGWLGYWLCVFLSGWCCLTVNSRKGTWQLLFTKRPLPAHRRLQPGPPQWDLTHPPSMQPPVLVWFNGPVCASGEPWHLPLEMICRILKNLLWHQKDLLLCSLWSFSSILNWWWILIHWFTVLYFYCLEGTIEVS